MNNLLDWRKSLACLSLLVGMSATAVVPAAVAAARSDADTAVETVTPQPLLAQRGDCREATRSIFIYHRPGREPFATLSQGEQVRLAESDPDRDGWIAIDEPTLGFVEAQSLRRCGTGIDPSFPGNSVQPGVAELCVNDRAGFQGLSIHDSPSFSARVIERAYQGERLRVNTREIRRDPSGFIWFPISFPTSGWVVYGLPNEGLINLENCELLRLRSPQPR